jgi:hypothetical protein
MSAALRSKPMKHVSLTLQMLILGPCQLHTLRLPGHCVYQVKVMKRLLNL